MRATQWKRRLEQQLEDRRSATVEKELSECTFHPQIRSGSRSGRRNRRGGSSENSGGNPEEHAERPVSPPMHSKGVNEFLERLKKARELKAENEKRLTHTGERWKYGRTVPEPFQLGKNVPPPGEIRCLRQPIQAPHRSFAAASYAGYLDLHSASHRRSTTEREGSPFDGYELPPPGSFSKPIKDIAER
jgi:hypothetical protein